MAVDAHMRSNAGTYNGYPGQVNGSHATQMMTPPSPNQSRRYAYEAEYSRTNALSNGYSQSTPQVTVNGMRPPPPPTLGAPQTAAMQYNQSQYTSPTAGEQQYKSSNAYSASQPAYAIQAESFGTTNTRLGTGLADSHMTGPDQYPVSNSRSNSMMDFMVAEQYQNAYANAMPVFGGDMFNRTPPTVMPIDDAFFSQLLDAGGIDLNLPPSPPLPIEPIIQAPPTSAYSKVEPSGTSAPAPDLPRDAKTSFMNGTLLDVPEVAIDSHIQSRLIKLVRGFRETEPLPGRRAKEDIVNGNTDNPDHALSVQMLRTALMSYWVHIHQQMPIMHRPTFQPRTCPDLLLLAMICLGGSCLERTHPAESAANCSEFAFFAAYHIRWAVFKDAEFRPTAKLWTFQTMLLLELFEKMYSTRALHERAHIHHATTLTVMRRGSSLIGRVIEIPGDDDPTRTPPGPEGSINTSGYNTHDAWWNRWITAEATRRVAFAAFVIDSTHATLFGHSAIMSPHDMRLPLPCDEALWAATSSAEVQRVEASLAANGFKTTTFLDGLKKTLNGQKVRTNTFGRVILMSGLLNISWHMNQRDLQVSSLGAKDTFGSSTRWRGPLTRAFDFWRKDFDESLAKSADYQHVCNPAYPCSVDHRDNVYESRSCLHSLAHMAMHVDIVDCEVFAGSDRALGRAVTESDRLAVQRRLREDWAPSARARDAVYYALRFLCETLVPEEVLSAGRAGRQVQEPSSSYSARDDYLLNRPWVLYFAAMIVWSYGFALDGPLKPQYTLKTPELQVADMQQYLIRMSAATSPDDLDQLEGRNKCLGLLLTLRHCFAQPRWELLHEAREMLNLCIGQLLPGNQEWKTTPV
jgi:hypothetical protein